MTPDGLNIDYQGVEGHGDAQVFGPNAAVQPLAEYYKNVADDIAKRKEEINKAAAGFDVDTSKVWEHDVPDIANMRAGLQKDVAMFSQKYNTNPRLKGTQEYYRDVNSLQQQQNDIMAKANQSAQHGAYYKWLTQEYAKNSDKYRPESQANLANMLAVQGEDKWNGKRSDLFNKNPLVHNVDEAAFVNKAAGAIGDFTRVTDNGVTKTTQKNIIFAPDGNMTDYGKSVALPLATKFVQSDEGQKIIANRILSNPKLTPDEAAGQLVTDILKSKDVQNQTDVTLQRPDKSEKTTQEVAATDGREISTLNYKTTPDGKEIGDGNVVPVRSDKTYSFSPVEIQYAPPFHIDMSTGHQQDPTGPVNYIFSSVDKLPYTVDPKTGETFIVDEKIKKQSPKGVKYGWFALGTEKAGMKNGEQVLEPRAIPLNKQLYDVLGRNPKGKVILKGLNEDELWNKNNMIVVNKDGSVTGVKGKSNSPVKEYSYDAYSKLSKEEQSKLPIGTIVIGPDGKKYPKER